ncbi:MAG: hypothetical protein R2991_01770 [Thermoanaerobaculia bacterium]
MRRLDRLFLALDRAGVRYVLVGGVAVNLRGHLRLTIDTDLIVDLEPGPARRAVEVLLELGLRPRLPEDPFDFADPATRRWWAEERNMQVFLDRPRRSAAGDRPSWRLPFRSRSCGSAPSRCRSRTPPSGRPPCST